MTVASDQSNGWDRITLVNEQVELSIFPQLGGRMASLLDHRTGREWLWSPATEPRLFRSRLGDDFGTSPHVGLDECIPTIAPCAWRGRALPDHGEMWALSWTVDPAALADGVVAMAVNLPVTPLRFERRIRLDDECVRFDYRLLNLGAQPEEYLWAMHPLFTLEAGDTLELPADVTSLKLECAGGTNAAGRGAIWGWPEPFAGIRLDQFQLPDNANGYLKAFALPREGWARLRNAAACSSLTILWDISANPCLGLWLTRGGYRGWHHVAVEPTNGASDSLTLAADSWRQAGRLAPYETRAWWVEWRLGA